MGPCQSKPEDKHPTEPTSSSNTQELQRQSYQQNQQTQQRVSTTTPQTPTPTPTPNPENIEQTVERSGKITKEYNLLSPPLGRGGFGEVRKAIHRATQQQRAIKIISKVQTTQAEQDKIKNEVEILKALDHPNIIKIFEFYQDEKNFYIVTELCTGGELFDQIQQEKNFSERKAAQLIRQVLSAIYYCHQHKIVHRDLKPENLLLESKNQDSQIKVIDFGTSRQFDPSQKLSQRLGTPYYIAPEVLKRKYDEKCDIWSVGVILYVLLCGYPPFNGKTDDKILEKVAKGEYDFESEEWDVISDEAKQFIRKLMEYDPKQRYSAQQCLEDPWIQKHSDQNQEGNEPDINKALQNMKAFRSTIKLQQATFMYIVNQLASKEEKNELLKTFQALDKNGDGVLSRQELLEGYKKTMGVNEATEQVNAIMIEVDKNNSGTIDYSEFVAASINKSKLLSQQRLEVAFKAIDSDGSGSITADELKQIFGGGRVPDEIWKQIIDEVDQNGDGQISLPEFKEMMMKLVV